MVEAVFKVVKVVIISALFKVIEVVPKSIVVTAIIRRCGHWVRVQRWLRLARGYRRYWARSICSLEYIVIMGLSGEQTG